MAENTMGKYFPLLSKKQREMIIHHVRSNNYDERAHLNMTTLPFLPVQEAAMSLHNAIEVRKRLGNLTGLRFLRTILSIIEASVLFKVCEGEVSRVIHLNDKKLAAHFKGRFADRFYLLRKPTKMACVERIRPNKWRITSHPKELYDAALLLTDICSRY